MARDTRRCVRCDTEVAVDEMEEGYSEGYLGGRWHCADTATCDARYQHRHFPRRPPRPVLPSTQEMTPDAH
jgi:hypothetical protein